MTTEKVIKTLETDTDFVVLIKKSLDSEKHYPWHVVVLDIIRRECLKYQAFETEGLANKKAKEWQKQYSTN